MQLPFAVIPLMQFTSDRVRMGECANAFWVKALSWLTAAVILGLNLWLVVQTLDDWLSGAGVWRVWLEVLLAPILLALALLLLYVGFEPRIRRLLRFRPSAPGPLTGEMEVHLNTPPRYRVILVTLDHSRLDRTALQHAAALAKTYGARLHLLHVEEGVASRLYGEQASTAEVQAGRQYLEHILAALREAGVEGDLEVVHAKSAPPEIIACARRLHPDLVIMGAHGHRGMKDIVYGATINHVRHAVGVPVLIVQEPPAP
jgi:manganese transport protein